MMHGSIDRQQICVRCAFDGILQLCQRWSIRGSCNGFASKQTPKSFSRYIRNRNYVKSNAFLREETNVRRCIRRPERCERRRKKERQHERVVCCLLRRWMCLGVCRDRLHPLMWLKKKNSDRFGIFTVIYSTAHHYTAFYHGFYRRINEHRFQSNGLRRSAFHTKCVKW